MAREDRRVQPVRNRPRWRGLLACLCASTGLHAGALALGSILIASRAGPAAEVEESFEGCVVRLSLGASRSLSDDSSAEGLEAADPVEDATANASGADASTSEGDATVEEEPELLAATTHGEIAVTSESPAQESVPALEQIAESQRAPESVAVSEVAGAADELAPAVLVPELPRTHDHGATEIAQQAPAPAELGDDRVGAERRDDLSRSEPRLPLPVDRSRAARDIAAADAGRALVLAPAGTAGPSRSATIVGSPAAQGTPTIAAARAGSARAGANRAFGRDDLRGLPELIDAPAPPYPANAVLSEEQGSVLCVLHVDTRGQVRSVDVEEGSGFARLDRAAIEGLARWKFRPFLRDGRAVAVRLRHRVVFRLDAPLGAIDGA